MNEAQALHDSAFPKANLLVHIQCCKDIRSGRVRAISSFNPFCRILVQGRSFETTVKEEETSPYWDETHTFKFEKVGAPLACVLSFSAPTPSACA